MEEKNIKEAGNLPDTVREYMSNVAAVKITTTYRADLSYQVLQEILHN